MKERPILLSAPMVRAILEGRKSQTRRAVKPQPFAGRYPSKCTNGWGFCHPQGEAPAVLFQCPYGVPGDRLWVRETWGIGGARLIDPCLNYRADGAQVPLNDGIDVGWCIGSRPLVGVDDAALCAVKDGWRPSIHMPRWASRITLEITEVRVQRVQEISAEDAIAEGCGFDFRDGAGPKVPRINFSVLWDSINGPRGFGWDVNPWVWALTFQKLP